MAKAKKGRVLKHKPKPASKPKPAKTPKPKSAKAPKPPKPEKKPKAPKEPKGKKGKDAAALPEITPQTGDIKLGPIVLPEPDQAVTVLKELAEVNDKALIAHGRYLKSKEETRDAKEKWDKLAEEVQRILRRSTHASDLPLLNVAEREADLAKLEEAKAKGGKVEDPPPPAPDAPFKPNPSSTVDDPPF